MVDDRLHRSSGACLAARQWRPPSSCCCGARHGLRGKLRFKAECRSQPAGKVRSNTCPAEVDALALHSRGPPIKLPLLTAMRLLWKVIGSCIPPNAAVQRALRKEHSKGLAETAFTWAARHTLSVVSLPPNSPSKLELTGRSLPLSMSQPVNHRVLHEFAADETRSCTSTVGSFGLSIGKSPRFGWSCMSASSKVYEL